MSPDMVEIVGKWTWEENTANERRKNVFQVQQFLGFCNHYQRFISDYSERPEQLTRVSKTDKQF